MQAQADNDIPLSRPSTNVSKADVQTDGGACHSSFPPTRRGGPPTIILIIIISSGAAAAELAADAV